MNENTPLVAVTIAGRPARATLSRREAMQWVLAALAASSLPAAAGLAQEVGRTPMPQEVASHVWMGHVPGGYGTDPALLKTYKPGDLWPLTFNEQQKAAARALADVIIPSDNLGSAASEAGVVEMMDEWISAPYPQQKSDRSPILEALAWIDAEAAKRFEKPFAALTAEQHRQICDDICYAPEAKPEFKKPADLFSRFRTVAAAAYYATDTGRKAIGYVGNIALEKFDGPPKEVLEKLGVEQTVG